MKNILYKILVVVILAFFFVFAYFFFNKIFIQKDISYINGSIGAFMGAFFAFLFIRVNTLLSEYYEKVKKNRRSLVKMERALNDCLNSLYDLIYLIDDFSDKTKESIKDSEPMVYFNKFSRIPLNKDISTDMSNIDFINDVCSYEINIEKLNNDIDTTNSAYADIKNAFIQQKLSLNSYIDNLQLISTRLNLLKAFANAQEKETILLLVKTRVLLKKSPFIFKSAPEKYPKDFKKAIINEKKKVDKEIRTMTNKRRAELDKIFSEPPTNN